MPSTTTLTMFFYVYIFEGSVDGNKYIGFTNDLRRRLEEHQKGKSKSTRPRLPMKLIYFESCLNEDDARRREHYFKTTGGRRFLAKRLILYYKSKL